ncbi:putative protein sll0944 [Planktothrix tepida]|uniref:Uncharacterized protein n=2 Tax=Planktothrix TaxID=54304 RepID=A0A1J1LGU7_9CYAN|nr:MULTISPECIES: DUF1830 domain-containing protein [Planktothrix]CAD5933027.1 putative protein sll0944 [Planktothrix tepida]CAD5977896.1 putative protein sll0944 [Planktothrix pseudagardhii]CUR31707.1 conserved hypothetical protein [Planktothrix tepida PCC 9214]
MQTVHLPVDSLKTEILCSYKNPTRQVQILRLQSTIRGYFERVVFPGEYCIFVGESHTDLEVYSSGDPTRIELEKIPCNSLKVEETE